MDELIQYYVVNQDLNMSTGKVAAQVAHVATIIAMYEGGNDNFHNWFQKSDQKKIILKGKQKDLEKLIDQGFYYIRDNGLTEIPAGSLTVAGLPPMPKSEAQQYVKRLRLY
jgi:peptidyl-tRNA hydrolase